MRAGAPSRRGGIRARRHRVLDCRPGGAATNILLPAWATCRGGQVTVASEAVELLAEFCPEPSSVSWEEAVIR